MSQKRAVIQKFVSLFNILLDQENKAGRSPEQISAELNAFKTAINDFNDNPQNEIAFPFVVVERDNDELLQEKKIDTLLKLANDAGLSDQVIKVVHDQQAMLFFRHSARQFIDENANTVGIAYMNMLSNGVVFDDFSFVGVYSASLDRLAAAKIAAESVLHAETIR